MLQLDNQTPFKSVMAVLPDQDAIDTLYVILKATLTLRPRLALAPEQMPPTLADEYHGDPTSSSLKKVSEMHIGKRGTDVLLTGRAWAPAGRATPEVWVRLTVAERQKTIRVFGDRSWTRDGNPSTPAPFEAMPLVWERAFGGIHQLADRCLGEERNPAGVGFAGQRDAAELLGQPVPNLEDPAAPLERLGQNPAPACFAPVAPHWLPRRAFAGTYDQQWQRKRAPYLPADFDRRFLQCATAEMTFDRFLQGSEPVEVRGVTPDAPISLTLPVANLEINVRVAGQTERPIANLETVLIEPDENRLCLTWRAALPCDRKVLKVEKVTVTRQRAGTRS
jgi:hypothetical protein